MALFTAGCLGDQGGSGHRGHHGGGGAQGGPGGPAGQGGNGGAEIAQLKTYDANGDGTLTHDELVKGLHAEFDKFDLDHDGVLNATETRSLNDARRAKGYELSPAFDWNADGHVDFNEFANQTLSLFERLDVNGGGILTPDELTLHQGPPGGGQGGQGSGGGHHHHGGGGGGGQ